MKKTIVAASLVMLLFACKPTSSYRVMDIETSATLVVNGPKGLMKGDTVWAKLGDVVDVNYVNNEDPYVRPVIIK